MINTNIKSLRVYILFTGILLTTASSTVTSNIKPLATTTTKLQQTSIFETSKFSAKSTVKPQISSYVLYTADLSQTTKIIDVTLSTNTSSLLQATEIFTSSTIKSVHQIPSSRILYTKTINSTSSRLSVNVSTQTNKTVSSIFKSHFVSKMPNVSTSSIYYATQIYSHTPVNKNTILPSPSFSTETLVYTNNFTNIYSTNCLNLSASESLQLSTNSSLSATNLLSTKMSKASISKSKHISSTYSITNVVNTIAPTFNTSKAAIGYSSRNSNINSTVQLKNSSSTAKTAAANALTSIVPNTSTSISKTSFSKNLHSMNASTLLTFSLVVSSLIASSAGTSISNTPVVVASSTSRMNITNTSKIQIGLSTSQVFTGVENSSTVMKPTRTLNTTIIQQSMNSSTLPNFSTSIKSKNLSTKTISPSQTVALKSTDVLSSSITYNFTTKIKPTQSAQSSLLQNQTLTVSLSVTSNVVNLNFSSSQRIYNQTASLKKQTSNAINVTSFTISPVVSLLLKNRSVTPVLSTSRSNESPTMLLNRTFSTISPLTVQNSLFYSTPVLTSSAGLNSSAALHSVVARNSTTFENKTKILKTETTTNASLMPPIVPTSGFSNTLKTTVVNETYILPSTATVTNFSSLVKASSSLFATAETFTSTSSSFPVSLSTTQPKFSVIIVSSYEPCWITFTKSIASTSVVISPNNTASVFKSSSSIRQNSTQYAAKSSIITLQNNTQSVKSSVLASFNQSAVIRNLSSTQSLISMEIIHKTPLLTSMTFKTSSVNNLTLQTSVIINQTSSVNIQVSRSDSSPTALPTENIFSNYTLNSTVSMSHALASVNATQIITSVVPNKTRQISVSQVLHTNVSILPSASSLIVQNSSTSINVNIWSVAVNNVSSSKFDKSNATASVEPSKMPLSKIMVLQTSLVPHSSLKSITIKSINSANSSVTSVVTNTSSLIVVNISVFSSQSSIVAGNRRRRRQVVNIEPSQQVSVYSSLGVCLVVYSTVVPVILSSAKPNTSMTIISSTPSISVSVTSTANNSVIDSTPAVQQSIAKISPTISSSASTTTATSSVTTTPMAPGTTVPPGTEVEVSINVNQTIDETTDDFKLTLEQRLAETFTSLMTGIRRKRREATHENATVMVTSIKRSGEQVNVDFIVKQHGVFVAADETATVYNYLSPAGLQKKLGYPVYGPVIVVVPPTEPPIHKKQHVVGFVLNSTGNTQHFATNISKFYKIEDNLSGNVIAEVIYSGKELEDRLYLELYFVIDDVPQDATKVVQSINNITQINNNVDAQLVETPFVVYQAYTIEQMDKIKITTKPPNGTVVMTSAFRDTMALRLSLVYMTGKSTNRMRRQTASVVTYVLNVYDLLNGNYQVLFAVSDLAVIQPATDAVAVINSVDSAEIENILKMQVVEAAAPVVSGVQILSADVDYWIIGAIIGPVALVSLVCCLLMFKSTRGKSNLKKIEPAPETVEMEERTPVLDEKDGSHGAPKKITETVMSKEKRAIVVPLFAANNNNNASDIDLNKSQRRKVQRKPIGRQHEIYDDEESEELDEEDEDETEEEESEEEPVVVVNNKKKLTPIARKSGPVHRKLQYSRESTPLPPPSATESEGRLKASSHPTTRGAPPSPQPMPTPDPFSMTGNVMTANDPDPFRPTIAAQVPRFTHMTETKDLAPSPPVRFRRSVDAPNQTNANNTLPALTHTHLMAAPSALVVQQTPLTQPAEQQAPMLQSGQQPQQQVDDELVHKLETERQRNKLRHRQQSFRQPNNNNVAEVWKKEQEKINSVLDDPGLTSRKTRKRRRMRRKYKVHIAPDTQTNIQSNELVKSSGSVTLKEYNKHAEKPRQPEKVAESSETDSGMRDARHRIHALLDDTFNAIKKYQKNITGGEAPAPAEHTPPHALHPAYTPHPPFTPKYPPYARGGGGGGYYEQEPMVSWDPMERQRYMNQRLGYPVYGGGQAPLSLSLPYGGAPGQNVYVTPVHQRPDAHGNMVWTPQQSMHPNSTYPGGGGDDPLSRLPPNFSNDVTLGGLADSTKSNNSQPLIRAIKEELQRLSNAAQNKTKVKQIQPPLNSESIT